MRGQHRDVHRGPQGSNVLDETEITNVGLPIPAFDLLARYRRGISRIRQTGNNQPNIAASLAEARVSSNKVADPLRLHESAEERDRDRAGRFRTWFEGIDVDAGAGNQ